MDHDAKSLILLSRNAKASRSKFPELLHDLEQRGCEVTLCDCDVSQKNDLFTVLRRCQETLPPIRGVIQGAMVLQDCVFEHMSHIDWHAALAPKVDGTMNLHEGLASQPLDFFIMLSSLIGISGHASQANYAAGSTFQDAFARYRASQGMPAIAIDVGWVKSVGYVAETKGVAERMARMGYAQLEQDKLLRILESAIRTPLRNPEESQIVTGIGSLEAAAKFDLPWRRERRFAALDNDAVSAGAKDVGGMGAREETKTLKEALKSVFTWAEAVGLLVRAVIGKISTMFSIVETDIDATLPLKEYGVDSLVAVELRNWLFAKAGAEMSMFDILQSKSLTMLAEKIAGKSAFVKEAGLEEGKK